MLYFDRIDVSDNETSSSEECDSCHYWYFLNKGFKFQPKFCNRSHDLLMMSMNLSDIAILNIKSADCRCIIRGTSKNEVIKLMQNAGLNKKSVKLQNRKIHYHV